ncbi:MAG: helix-turn-helix domain-containing protein [Patescibacteria group bacterium]|nr:MAG: helix-turn-helix domain-containing protein [Patescibacteria group bacterium]
MVAFQEKSLDDRTIGEALRAAREERGETLEDVERVTHVSKKYIAAVENNDLKKLPEAVYTKKFVRALASHYGLDPEAAAESLLKEVSAGAGALAVQRPVNYVEGRSLVASPILLKSVLIAVAFVGILGYFAFSVRSILKPPSVTLYSPHDDQVFSTGRVVLEGQTEREVDLAVNGEPVSIEADGSFKDVLNLPPGVSTLRLIAKKKHSREQEIFIKVVIDEPKELGSASGTEAEP